MSKKRSLSAISKAQNSLRPFYKKYNKPFFWKQLQSVRAQTPPEEYKNVCSFIEDNKVYPFVGLGNNFPRKPEDVPNRQLAKLAPLPLERELALQVIRLNFYKDTLSKALQSISQINARLSAHEFEAAESAISKHKEAYGYSLVLLKKELLLTLERHGLSGLSKRTKALYAGRENTGWALMCHFVFDLADPTYSPDRAIRGWLRLANNRVATSAWYARLIQDQVLTQSGSDALIASALLRYSALSNLDLTLFLWRVQAINPNDSRLSRAFAQLDKSVAECLSHKCSDLHISIPSRYRFSEKLPSDIDVYRTSFFYDDIASVAKWMCVFNRLIFAHQLQRLDLDERLDSKANEIAAAPQRWETSISELRAWEQSIMQPGIELGSQKFLATIVIAQSLRQLAINPSGYNPAATAHLLAATTDVHLYLSLEDFRKLLEGASKLESGLLVFVIREMIYRTSRNQDNELERRIAFMSLFKGKPGQDIIRFLDELAAESSEIALLVARVCTRSFLERLYLIMTSVKDVIETRICVCEWLEFQKAEPDASTKEEADALKRELANLEARSDIDSTRVHVDEDSLREWFYNTQSASATRYIQTVLSEGPGVSPRSLLNFYSAKDRKDKQNVEEEDLTADTQIGSEFLLSQIVDQSLNAFAVDRTFGLDAYLSRRIRHGTLSGQVITPVVRVLKKLTDYCSAHEIATRNQISDVEKLTKEWQKFLVSELDHIRKDIIQIRSASHPSGLIHATWQTVVNIAHVDAMIARVRSSVIETDGRYDIFPDIYALCCDCLEPDLAQLRLYMVREFFPRAASKLLALYEALGPEERGLAKNFLGETRAVLEGRIQEVCGWFIRPVFRRDRYNLKRLITSTFSIVRELDDRYAFTEDVDVSDEVTLNRGAFDLFSDVLFVLIGNAAKHGKVDGRVSVSVVATDSDSRLITLIVTSEVDTLEEHERALSRIRAATTFEAVAIERAAVEEGFSGLRKLVGVLRRVRSANVALPLGVSGGDLTISFRVTLPTDIIQSREIVA